MRFALILIIPLLLILSNTISLFYNDSFYQKSNLNENETKDIIGFFEGGELGLYDSAELSHMKDVRKLINAGKILLLFLVLSLAIFLAYEKNNYWLLIAGAIMTILILILFLFFNFSNFFTWFHTIFFPQGNWQFDSSSKLINDFQFSFFESAGKKIFVDTLWQSGLVFVLGLGAKIYKNKKNPKLK